MNIEEIGKQLKKYREDNQLTQKQLATATNTDQPHISRILNARITRMTPKIREICKYASIDLDVADEDQNPANNADLMDAISLVWDGTDKRARALAKVIRSLKDLS